MRTGFSTNETGEVEIEIKKHNCNKLGHRQENKPYDIY